MKTDGKFFEAGGNAARLLEPTDTLLDDVAPAVGVFVEARASIVPGMFVVAVGDDRSDAPRSQPGAKVFGTVPLVSGQRIGTPARRSAALRNAHGVDDGFGAGGFVDLPRREDGDQRHALAVGDKMDLGAEPALATSQGMIGRFLRIED